MPGIDEEIEENEELEGGSPETQEKPEPEKELPQDPNEPIQVETDEAKQSKRRQARAERQNKYRQMEEDVQRLRRETEELRQRAYQPPQQQYQQQQQQDPVRARLAQIDAARTSLDREYRALHTSRQMTDQMEAEFQQKARDLNRAEIAVVTQASQPQIDRQAIVREAMWTQFTTKHADVFHDPNPNIQKWAWAEYHRRIAEGHPDTEDMVEDILDQTRVKFGKQPRRSRGSRPDDNTRARMTGIRSGGSGANVGESGMIEMSAHDKKMARIAFGDRKDKDGKQWSEQKVYQYWANTVGKKRAAMGKKTG